MFSFSVSLLSVLKYKISKYLAYPGLLTVPINLSIEQTGTLFCHHNLSSLTLYYLRTVLVPSQILLCSLNKLILLPFSVSRCSIPLLLVNHSLHLFLKWVLLYSTWKVILFIIFQLWYHHCLGWFYFCFSLLLSFSCIRNKLGCFFFSHCIWCWWFIVYLCNTLLVLSLCHFLLEIYILVTYTSSYEKDFQLLDFIPLLLLKILSKIQFLCHIHLLLQIFSDAWLWNSRIFHWHVPFNDNFINKDNEDFSNLALICLFLNY